MTNRQVVVQLSTDGTTRVAEFVSNHGVLAKVRWEPEEDLEEVRLGGDYHLVTEGTLRHNALLNPGQVKQQLAENPRDVFVRQLRETNHTLNAADLKNALEQMGLDAKAVASAWAKARKTLMDVPGVTMSNKQPRRYGWAEKVAARDEPQASPVSTEETGSLDVDSPDVATEEAEKGLPNASLDGGQAPAHDETGPTSASDSATTGGGEPGATGRSDPKPTGGGDPGPTLHATIDEVRSLIDQAAAEKLNEQEAERLRVLISARNVAPLFKVVYACLSQEAPDHASVRTLAVTPLATAKALSRFSELACMAVATAAQLDESHELGLVVCCLPKFVSIDKVDVPASITRVGVRRLVTGMLIELGKMQLAARPDAYLGVASAVRRIVASSIFDEVETSHLVRLLQCLDLVSSNRPASAEELEIAVVDAVANRLRLSGSGADRLPDDELSILARAAALLPFARSKGRSGLMAALARSHPDELASPRWWTGLVPEDLVVAGNGALGSVLALEAVSREIVAPLALETVRAAKLRRDLSWVLTVPGSVSDQVPVADVARAATAIADTDDWMRSWLEHLRDAKGRKQLEAHREHAEAERRQAVADLQAAQASLLESESRNRRLQSMVSTSHKSEGDLRSAQDRQVKIDAMRAIAQLGAMVTGSAGRLSDEQLVARVQSALARQSLTAIGQLEARLPFDPSLHDCSDLSVMPGEAVTVTRPGYTWETNQEAIVLVKAIVDRAVEHESN